MLWTCWLTSCGCMALFPYWLKMWRYVEYCMRWHKQFTFHAGFYISKPERVKDEQIGQRSTKTGCWRKSVLQSTGIYAKDGNGFSCFFFMKWCRSRDGNLSRAVSEQILYWGEDAKRERSKELEDKYILARDRNGGNLARPFWAYLSALFSW